MDHVNVTAVLVAVVLAGNALQIATNWTGRWKRWLNELIKAQSKELKSQSESLATIKREVQANGGTSLADRVDRIETSVRGLDRKLSAHIEKVTKS